jgi:hypothetical protein
MQLKEVILFAD